MADQEARSKAPAEQAWERGWEAHELAQLERLARLSFREKLAWLDEAHRLVRQLQSRRGDHAAGDAPAQR